MQKGHGRSMEAISDLEFSLSAGDSERKLLKTELTVLRDEYSYLKKSMQVSLSLLVCLSQIQSQVLNEWYKCYQARLEEISPKHRHSMAYIARIVPPTR